MASTRMRQPTRTSRARAHYRQSAVRDNRCSVVAGDAQNGAPDGIALIDTDDGALLDALSYEGGITAAVISGRTYSLVEGTMLPENVADSNATAGSLSRIPDGADTNDAASDWVFTTTLTRGAANVATTG
jgi:hypothetical protein